MISVKLDYKTVIATALLGAGVVWLAKKSIESVIQKGLPDSVNPVSQTNFVNRAFGSVWDSLFPVAVAPRPGPAYYGGDDAYNYLYGGRPWDDSIPSVNDPGLTFGY